MLIHAAAGGVGSAAVQIAQAFGARVIGTASEANQDYLRELGAEAVTYGPGLADRIRSAAEEAGAVTAVLDAVGTEESVAATVELLPDRGRAVITAPGKHSQEAGIAAVQQQEGRIMDVATLAAEGLITFTIAHRLPLVEAAEALELSRERPRPRQDRPAALAGADAGPAGVQRVPGPTSSCASTSHAAISASSWSACREGEPVGVDLPGGGKALQQGRMVHLPQQVDGHLQPPGDDKRRGKDAPVRPRHLRAVDPLLAFAGGEHQGAEPAEKFDGGRRLSREVMSTPWLIDVVGQARLEADPGFLGTFVLPPGIEDRDGDSALVARAQVLFFDLFGHLVR